MRLKALSLALSLGAGIAVASVIFTGCATITSGPREEVSLRASNGDKVIVTIDNRKLRLPATIKLKRKGEMIYLYSKDNPNYQDSAINSQAIGRNEVMLPQNLVALLDIFGVLAFILPGFTSLAVDQATGSVFKYANKQLVLPVYPKCVR